MRTLINIINDILEKPIIVIIIRLVGYIVFALVGIVLLGKAIKDGWLQAALDLLKISKEAKKPLESNNVLQSAIYIFILTFPLVTYNWFLKNKDTTQQLEDARRQLENASRQQTETILSNALTLLLKKGDSRADILARSNGLTELLRLKRNNPDKEVQERIGQITSSGLNLTSADLKAAYLSNAPLEDAIYDNNTVFPAGFSPEDSGMRHIDTLTIEEKEEYGYLHLNRPDMRL